MNKNSVTLIKKHILIDDKIIDHMLSIYLSIKCDCPRHRRNRAGGRGETPRFPRRQAAQSRVMRCRPSLRDRPHVIKLIMIRQRNTR
jgi:hypothetical protein